MSVKKLFDARQNKKTGNILTKTTAKAVGDEIESFEQVKSALKEKNEFIPGLDYSKPENFVKFGSAEKYYIDAMEYVINYYPYDGSSKEKIDFRLSLNPLEKHVLDSEHPGAIGHITLGNQIGTPEQYLATGYYKQEGLVDNFIHIKGGPNASTKLRADGDPDYRDPTANIYYDGSDFDRRSNNLEFGGPAGTTIEFFLKKDGMSATKEVIYDVYNGLAANAPNYGRFTIELDTDNFYVTYEHTVDGAAFTGFEQKEIPSSGDPGAASPSLTDNKWRHYAIVISESGTSTLISLYRDGKCTWTETVSGANKQIPLVTGAIEARIGAFVAPTRSGTTPAGYGTLVASLDEFRVWKDARNSEEIGRNWFTNLNGGTNTRTETVGASIADVNLGLYFKFNEGIVGDSSTDAVILDYSGRISNGAWTGYVAGARVATSAMVESSASVFEHADPIVRASHPDYVAKKELLLSKGRSYDYSNNASLYHSMPSWIIEEDEASEGNLQKLTQIMSSHFDTLYAQITTLSRVKDATYTSGSNKPFPHNERLLQSLGFETPEIFSNANLLSQFLQKDDKRQMEEKLHNIKNEIYKNIYNNLNYVYKSKGTPKAFRNLVRCYGAGDDLFKINAYVDNQTYVLEDKYEASSAGSKYVDMSGMSRSDDRSAFVTQFNTNPTDLAVHGLMVGDASLDSFEFTLTADVLFPEFPKPGTPHYNSYSNTVSSIFGFHTPLDTASSSTTLTWAASDYGLMVTTERGLAKYPEIHSPLAASRDAKFVVRNRAGDLLIESSPTTFFKNLYKNKRWVLALSLRPTRYPFAETAVGTADGDYTLTLTGVNSLLGEIQDSFEESATISATVAENILRSPKRIYAGAEVNNFNSDDGVLVPTDIRLGGVRFWNKYLPKTTIELHSKGTGIYGAENPLENAYNFQTNSPSSYVPTLSTLAMNWDFNTNSKADAAGTFEVLDYTSGSLPTDYEGSNQGTLFSNLNLRHHTGKAMGFASGSQSVSKEFVYSGRQRLPEQVFPEDMVKVLDADDEIFTPSTRPSRFFFAVENSMYDAISQEMLELFATIQEFNSLIGDPIHKYRQQYKTMEKMRDLFYARVGNSPDLDKYLEYYKWLDSSMGVMIEQLFPASARVAEDVRTIVESHVLERNKYQHKFPTLEPRPSDPESSFRGVGCGNRYSWKFNHAPLNTDANPDELGVDQAVNCGWWASRWERTHGTPEIQSAIRTLDDRINNLPYPYRNKGETIPFEATAPICLSTEFGRTIGGGVNQERNKIRNTSDLVIDQIVQPSPLCDDDLEPNKQRVVTFRTTRNSQTYSGDMVSPFSLYSSSVDTGYRTYLETQGFSSIDFTNIHEDSYHNAGYEVPMQGPFTSQHVGGLLYRNVTAIQTNPEAEAIPVDPHLDPDRVRPEFHVGTFAAATASYVSITTQSLPAKGHYYRDSMSKSPANIKNIQTSTSNRILGNFTKNYEVVHTQDKNINNLDLRLNAANYDVTGSLSPTIGGLVDYEIPQRKLSFVSNDTVIVERFSSPGGPSVNTPHNLDLTSLQFSPNNALPFRNLIVRSPHHANLAKVHTWGGINDGIYPEVINANPSTVDLSDLNAAGYSSNIISTHKTAKNGLERIKMSGASLVTSSIDDNAFVGHPIPQGDRYHWFMSLSGSTVAHVKYDLITPGTEVIGYGLSRTLYDEFVSNNSTYPNRPNSYGIALPESEPIDSSLEAELSAIGYDYRHDAASAKSYTKTSMSDPTQFKYKWADDYHSRTAAWSPISQLRVAETPLGRAISKTNKLTAYKKTNTLLGDYFERKRTGLQTQASSARQVYDNPEIYREPIIVSRHKPMRHHILAFVGTPKKDVPGRYRDVKLEYSYGNIKQGFAYDDANNDFNFIPNSDPRPFDILARISREYNEGNESAYRVAGIKEIKEFTYEEVIYPRCEYTYLPETRARISGSSAVTYWRDNGFVMTEGVYETNWDSLYNDFPDPAGITALASVNRINSEEYQQEINPEVTRLVVGKLTSQGNHISKVDQVAQYATFYDDIGSGSLSCWAMDSFQYSNYTRHSPWTESTSYAGSDNNGPRPLIAQLTVQYQPSGELMALPPGFSAPTITEYSSGPSWGKDVIIWKVSGSADYSHASYLYSTVRYKGGFSLSELSLASDWSPNHVGGSSTRPAWTAGSKRRSVSGANKSEILSPRYPFYDSYKKFAEEIKTKAKDYTVVPEYRISKNVELLLMGGVDSLNTPQLAVLGVTEDSSYLGSGDRVDPSFLRRYSSTSLFDSLGDVLGDRNTSPPTGFTMTAETTQKVIPYDGFYPMIHTLSLATLFSESLSRGTIYNGSRTNNYWAEQPIAGDRKEMSTPSDSPAWQIMLNPYFAPGILFNSIKSGIAVDYPVRTTIMGDAQSDQFYTPQKSLYNQTSVTNDYYSYHDPLHGVLSGSVAGGSLQNYDINNADAAHLYWSERLPFESIINPVTDGQQGPKIICSDTHRVLQHSITGSLKIHSQEKYEEYQMAMGNFLGGTPEFFLDGSTMSSIRSNVSNRNEIAVRKGVTYAMEVVLRRTEQFNQYSNPYAFGQPTSTGSRDWDAATTNGANPPPMNWPVHRAESAPFTPPYYYGDAIARITYTPKNELFTGNLQRGNTSLTEILSDLQDTTATNSNITYHNTGDTYYDADPSSVVAPLHGWNRAWLNKMNISASIIIDNQFDKMLGTNTPELSQWVIMPKWECPILDFPREFGEGEVNAPDKHNFSSSIENSKFGTGLAPEKTYGMWHQYGVEPDKGQGIQMLIRPVPSNKSNRSEKFLDTSILGKKAKYLLQFTSAGEQTAIVSNDWVSTRGNERFVLIPVTKDPSPSPALHQKSSIVKCYYLWYSDSATPTTSEDPLATTVLANTTNGSATILLADTSKISVGDYVLAYQPGAGAAPWDVSTAEFAGAEYALVDSISDNVSVTLSIVCSSTLTARQIIFLRPKAFIWSNGAYAPVGIKIDINGASTPGEILEKTRKGLEASLFVNGTYLTVASNQVEKNNLLTLESVNVGSLFHSLDFGSNSIQTGARIGVDLLTSEDSTPWASSAGIQRIDIQDGVWPSAHGYVQNYSHDGVAIIESERTILDAHDTLGDLSALLGFTGSEDEGGIAKTTLGRLATEKKVHEAIIAIPFSTNKDGSASYIRIPEPTNGEDGPRTKELMAKFQKYSLPPALRKDLEELLKSEEQRDHQPVSCYLFEFSTVFSKQDLADIWQGIMPEQSTRIQGKEGEVTVTSIDHAMPAQDFKDFNTAKSRVDTRLRDLLDVVASAPHGFHADIQWMVFKVKQKGVSSHSDMIKKTLGGAIIEPHLILPGSLNPSTSKSEIYYNWPYDYFSLIESAKITGKVKFRPNAKEIHPLSINYEDLAISRIPDIANITTTDLSDFASALQGDILRRVASAQENNIVIDAPPIDISRAGRLNLGSIIPGLGRLPGF